MTKNNPNMVMRITAHDPDTIEKELNAAVDIARAHAMLERRYGILVTQYDYSTYTVTISPNVPYGQTHEQRKTSVGTISSSSVKRRG